MFNFENSFNGMFGKIASGLCRLTMNGNIAVKCSNGYKTYDVSKNMITNVTNFCFNLGDEMFFVIPTNKVDVGDIILVGTPGNQKPKCVIESDGKVIKVIDYENNEIREVLPERHIFMGNVFFYGKIVSMFGNSFKKGKGLENIMKMMIVSQMMGGNNGANQNSGMGGFGQLMAMSMFMGGKGSNPFEDMFDFDFNFESAEEDEPSADKSN